MASREEKIQAHKKRSLDEIMWEMTSAYDEVRPINLNKIQAHMQIVNAANLVASHAASEDEKERVETRPISSYGERATDDNPLNYLDSGDGEV